MIENLPKGQIPDPHDPRDFQYSAVLTAPPVINWEQGFRLAKVPDTDQNQGDCCVAEAASKAHWRLKGKQFSVRSLFAYIALDYGAYIRDGVKRIVDVGQETLEEAPDPNPKTVQNMRDKTGLRDDLAKDDKEFSYFSLNNIDMDSWADAIQKYPAIIFGVQGTNEGWQNLLVPEPPKPNDFNISGKVWGHGLDMAGFHMHTNPDGTRERCIIAESSWCSAVKEHHLRERYFKAQCTNSAWVLIPNQEIDMNSLKLVDDNGTYYLVGDKAKIGLVDPASLALFKQLTDKEEQGSTSSIPLAKPGLIEQGLVLHN